MTEKPPVDTTARTQPDEFISDAELAQMNEWVQGTTAAPAQNQALEQEFKLPTAADAARRAMESSPASTETGQFSRMPSKKGIAWGAAATASLAAGLGGIIGSSGGDAAPELQESDKIVNTITLLPDARVRQDPEVNNPVTGPNTLFQPGKEITIESDDGIRVLEGTDNGTWYGISTKDLATEIPNAESLHDADSIVWVNEQKVKLPPQEPESSE